MVTSSPIKKPLTIEVPEMTANPPCVVGQVEKMCSPGAVTSGLISSSNVGPQELNELIKAPAGFGALSRLPSESMLAN